MALDTLAGLRAAVLGLRTDKLASFPDYLALAEQRIYNGDGEIEPLRVREMEATDTLTLVSGDVTLPGDYLDKRGLYYQATTTVSVPYEDAGTFYESELQRRGGSYPMAYTIEGTRLRVQPAISDDIKLLYYERPAAMVDDADTNDILTAYPSIYLHACGMELWRGLRNDQEQSRSTSAYVGALQAANSQRLNSRIMGVPLRKKAGMWQC